MEIFSTWNRPDRKLVINQVLLVCFIDFISLFGRCKAQTNESEVGAFTLVIIVTVALCSFFCVCFWVLFAVCYVHHRDKNTSRIPLPSTPTQDYDSTFNIQRPSGYPQSQVYYDEPVSSLPEATLHQGDLPPPYDEAVRMKTVYLT